MNALELNGIKKTFKAGKSSVVAVDGVTLAFPDSGIFGLLGMNGAGKSTTIKICTGLMLPDEGNVSVLGHPPTSPEAKKLVNVSPQETAVAPQLSVWENLTFIARIYGADKAEAQKKADEVIARLKLTEKANAKAGKLSGGLMRRLSIGMAMITNPKLIFLDEPTLGLDIVARRELWRCIREIAEHATVILTTHYLEEAEALCERIAIMAHGKITAVGTADELKALAGQDKFEDAFLKLSGEEDYIGE